MGVQVVRRDARQVAGHETYGDQHERGGHGGAAGRAGHRGTHGDQGDQRQRVHPTVLDPS